ncbi:BppU family phage baseplate upper protein (plasmid) [Clostridium perfringens]
MKEIYINADDYNSDSIRTIQGNNNAEEYKIYLQYDNEKIDLTNKTVNLAFLKVGSTDGDIIENLNVTDPVNGEITLKITNKLTRKNGTYSCQLAILGEEDFLEHTATFTLTVENNIFKDITKAIADSKDFTYLERILEEAKTVSGDLKTNIPVATNLNSSLESNISNARNINTTLADTTEKSKVAATDAIEKKSQLEKSITKAKEFIDGLDGSQNIPGIRMELTELQNGLKSNQALAYKGSSINAENTLEGRTEGMRIDGITLINCILTPIVNKTYTGNSTQQMYNYKVLRKANTLYTIIAFISKNTLNNSFSLLSWGRTSNGNPISITAGEKGLIKKSFTTNDNTEDWFLEVWKENSTGEIKIDYMMVLEGDWTSKKVPEYFEGLKSFGEAEKVEDKYKISIFSSGKNILKPLKSYSTINGFNLNNILKNGVQYTVTNTKNQLVKIAEFKDADTFLGQSTNGKFTFTFDNSKQQKLYIWKKYDSQVAELFTNEDIDFVMIEEGTGTIFEPYKEDKKDILIKEPVRKSDYLYEDNGQVKIDKFKGQYIFTGNENIERRIMANEIKTIGFGIRVSSLENCKMGGECLSNNFIYSESNHCWNVDKECVSIADFLHFRIDKSKLTTPDVEGFKAWLKANPTTVVYQLAEPTVEIVENCVDIDLDTFGEKTYFNILNSIKGSLDFKVPSNLGSSLQNLAKEVNNIWDVINNLLVPSIVKANGNIAMIKLNNNLK